MDEEKKGSILWGIFKDYVHTTLVPQLKNTASNTATDITYKIADMFANVISKRIEGKDAPTISRVQGAPNQAAASRYQNKYPNHIVTAPSTSPVQTNSATEVKQIPIFDEAKAQDIKNRMVQTIKDLGYVRIADYYSACGESPLAQHYRFGWINPADINYVPKREMVNGNWETVYYFILPTPVEVKNIR